MVYVDCEWYDRDDDYGDTDPLGLSPEDEPDVRELDFGDTERPHPFDHDVPDDEPPSPYFELD